MTQFRTKLAAILLSLELNKRKGCLLVKVDNEAIGSPSDVEILQSSNSPCKRKKYHPTSVACSSDRAMDPFLLCGLSTFDMPMTKEDLTDMLCDYIMTINDAETLETIWVRSFQPYNVSVTVRQLQTSLRMKQPMPRECFNIGVRLLAYSEYKRLTSANVKVSKHNMDLRFCVLMPWRKGGIYNLFVLDRKNKTLSVLDPTPIPDWCKDMSYKYYMCKIIDIASYYRLGTGVKANERPIDVFYWKHILQSGIPIIEDRNLSALIVVQCMSAWSNGQLMPISTDGQRLRKNFVIDLLAYDGNSRRCMIPVSVRNILAASRAKDFEIRSCEGLIYHALILTLDLTLVYLNVTRNNISLSQVKVCLS